MKDLGNYLKKERIASGVSLDEAANDMGISVTLLENIELGNTKAFKDIYELRELVKKYAKYLGLDINMVNDSFNDFLFEKTSKISLEDIEEALKKEELKEKEDNKNVKVIHSPYTSPHKRKLNLKPIIIWLAAFLVIVSISLLVIRIATREPVRDSELKCSWKENVYEFTY